MYGCQIGCVWVGMDDMQEEVPDANENGLHVPDFLHYANGTATTTSSHGEQLKFGLMKKDSGS